MEAQSCGTACTLSRPALCCVTYNYAVLSIVYDVIPLRIIIMCFGRGILSHFSNSNG
jgi:hypothetical protein